MYKPRSEHRKGIAAVLFAALLWSTGGMFIKLISFSAMPLSFFRSAFAAVTIIFIGRRSAFRFSRQVFINAVVYSAVLILFVAATKATTAANAIFLQYTAPIYVLIFEPILLKTNFDKKNLLTLVICFGGMVLFFLGDLQPGQLQGNVYALLSGIAFASYFLGIRIAKKSEQFASVFYGNVIIVLVCAFYLPEVTVFTFSDMLMVAYLGIIQIGLAYVIFGYGAERIKAVEASIFAMIEPVLNPVWVLLAYGEKPSDWASLGGVVILSGILLKILYLDTLPSVSRINRS